MRPFYLLIAVLSLSLAHAQQASKWWCRDIAKFNIKNKFGRKRFTCNVLRQMRNKNGQKSIRKICNTVVTFKIVNRDTLPVKYWCTKTCQFLCFDDDNNDDGIITDDKDDTYFTDDDGIVTDDKDDTYTDDDGIVTDDDGIVTDDTYLPDDEW